MEKSAIIVDDKKISNIMNNYFINITKTLKLKTLNKSQIDIDKFENNISVKENTRDISRIYFRNFYFEQVSSDIVRKEILNLNVKQIINIWFDSYVYFKTMR